MCDSIEPGSTVAWVASSKGRLFLEPIVARSFASPIPFVWQANALYIYSANLLDVLLLLHSTTTSDRPAPPFDVTSSSIKGTPGAWFASTSQSTGVSTSHPFLHRRRHGSPAWIYPAHPLVNELVCPYSIRARRPLLHTPTHSNRYIVNGATSPTHP